MAILAAIDENERSSIVARLAADLAVTYDDTLIALHVVPDEDFTSHKKSIESLPEFREYSFTQEEDSASRFAREFVLESVEEIDPDMVEGRGRVGDVVDEILSVAATIEPRFLVISGRRRSPAGKAVFGNTAQQVLLNVDCPVVTKMSRN